ncbi:hypothetical protein ACJX0J_013450, partial [Zea mays]
VDYLLAYYIGALLMILHYRYGRCIILSIVFIWKGVFDMRLMHKPDLYVAARYMNPLDQISHYAEVCIIGIKKLSTRPDVSQAYPPTANAFIEDLWRADQHLNLYKIIKNKHNTLIFYRIIYIVFYIIYNNTIVSILQMAVNLRHKYMTWA